MNRPIKHCYWVSQGQLLAGEYPRDKDESASIQKINALLQAGVTAFIDLTQESDDLLPYTELLQGTHYHRFPVRDISVPSSTALTKDILDTIDDHINRGRIVYVHCWGGVGRTGTIVGCWLARRGYEGHAALSTLQELWRQCPKSVHRNSPETEEQKQYILNWKEPQVTSLKRYLGCMLGLAVGDAVGTTVEFKAPGTFPLVRDMVGGGPFGLQPGEWTDDTSMALCLAQSLVSCKGFNAHDQIKRYIRWWKEGYLSSNGKCFDIGNTVSQALQKYQASNDPFAGSSDSNTAGNGSLMRLASIPLFFAADPEKAIMMCAESSRTTHGSRACLDACRYFGGLLIGAIQGVTKEELLSPHFTPIATLWDRIPLCHEINEVAKGSFKCKEPPEIVGSGYVVKALEAALWAFYRSTTFEEGCLLAVNLGNDADTTAAIYGQIAGAYYGLDGIPVRWLDRLVHKDDIVDITRQLYAQSVIQFHADLDNDNDRDNEECHLTAGFDIDQVIEFYSKDDLIGPDDLVADRVYLWPRFKRAVVNQNGNGSATVSRYALWADTVKGFIVEARKLIRNGSSREAEKLLIQSINSLSAFSHVQSYLDSLDVLNKKK